MMLSVAELIDKLIIENIKIFRLRESLHEKNIGDEEYVMSDNKMNLLNENRSIIMGFLDEKIHAVVVNTERNRYLRDVKTYAKHKDEK